MTNCGVVNLNRLAILTISATVSFLVFCQVQHSYQENPIDTSFQQNKTQDIQAPLEQYESGKAVKDIQCSSGLRLALKAENGHPVCLTTSTAQALLSRGFILPLTTLSAPFHLLHSIASGSSPLMVGFYLQNDNISSIKYWNFGDNRTDNSTHSYIENHMYVLPHINDTKWNFKGNVTIEYPAKNKVTIENFSVTVFNKDKRYIRNLDQYEGVIYQKDADGFDISVNGTELPDLRWVWGDKQVISGKSYTNPFHPYNNYGNFTGAVKLTPQLSSEYDTWNFGVLVLSSEEPKPTRIYDQPYPTDLESAAGTDQFRVGQKLCFYFSADNNNEPSKKFVPTNTDDCKVIKPSSESNKFSDPANIDHTVWNFSNTQRRYTSADLELSPTYTFTKNGTYSVNCTITYYDNTNITLSKAISILPLRTLSMWPNPVHVGDTIHVNGSYYAPEQGVDVWADVGRDGTYLTTLQVNPITKIIDGTFQLPDNIPVGQHIMYVTNGTDRHLAEIKFSVTQ